jgi:hypothetical protein
MLKLHILWEPECLLREMSTSITLRKLEFPENFQPLKFFLWRFNICQLGFSQGREEGNSSREPVGG